MISIGRSFGKKIVALVTDMSQPLGACVGNAMEVAECLEILNGQGAHDLVILCRELSAHGMMLGDVVRTIEEGRKKFEQLIASGKAMAKFREMVIAQGGDATTVSHPERLPRARNRVAVAAASDGFVRSIDTECLGNAMCRLGAGREVLASGVDHAAGMRVLKKIGDPVREGEPLCVLHYNENECVQQAVEQVRGAYTITPEQVKRPSLIRKVLTSTTAVDRL